MAIDATGINIAGFGYRTFETISASTLTTDLNDTGKVMNFTATCVVTLHAVAAGECMTYGENFGSYRSLVDDTRGASPLDWGLVQGRMAKGPIARGVAIALEDVE